MGELLSARGVQSDVHHHAEALREQASAVIAPLGLRLAPEKTRVVHSDPLAMISRAMGWLTLFLIGTDLFIMSPLLPPITRELGVPAADGGWAVTTFAMCRGRAPAGRLRTDEITTDRPRARRALVEPDVAPSVRQQPHDRTCATDPRP
jgi:hypothetical protein